MDRFKFFATVLSIGYLIDVYLEMSKKSIDRGYEAELKAGNYATMRFTKPVNNSESELLKETYENDAVTKPLNDNSKKYRSDEIPD